MKNALLLSPLVTAMLFTLGAAWQLLNRDEGSYIPVVYELLVLVFGYLAAAVINLVVIIPLSCLVRLKTGNILAGIGLALLLALVGTTVAYAYEIFDYRSSILHPVYLYPLFIPLFAMTLLSFLFLARAGKSRQVNVQEAAAGTSGDGGDTP